MDPWRFCPWSACLHAPHLLAGAECSSEPLETGPSAGSGSHVSLCHLPALLYPLWADVRLTGQRPTQLRRHAEYLPFYHTSSFLKPKKVKKKWRHWCIPLINSSATQWDLLGWYCTHATTQNVLAFFLSFLYSGVFKSSLSVLNWVI